MPRRKIGVNLYSSGLRSRKEVRIKGKLKNIIVAWIQPRCKICKRFLPKCAEDNTLCRRCKPSEVVKKVKEWRRKNPYRRSVYQYLKRHFSNYERVPIGLIF